MTHEMNLAMEIRVPLPEEPKNAVTLCEDYLRNLFAIRTLVQEDVQRQVAD